MYPGQPRYAGIGSRNTPEHIGHVMRDIAESLAAVGYVLRSGGASGADTYFASGAKDREIWDPRREIVPVRAWALEEAEDHSWEFPLQRMRPFVRSLIVRNMYQILGEDGDAPVTHVVCWTPTLDPTDKDAGGTRYAVRCAKARGIPVYNLRDPDTLRVFQ